jgi:hypothetical protein
MSADEIATFLVKLREAGILLSATDLDTRVQNKLTLACGFRRASRSRL